MKQYNIYSGLNGSFGGARYNYTASFETKEQAEEAAFESACNNYESYEGVYEILSYYDIQEQYCEENGLDSENLSKDDYEEIDDMYSEERESWISYYVIPTEEDKNVSPEELQIMD